MPNVNLSVDVWSDATFFFNRLFIYLNILIDLKKNKVLKKFTSFDKDPFDLQT